MGREAEEKRFASKFQIITKLKYYAEIFHEIINNLVK